MKPDRPYGVKCVTDLGWSGGSTRRVTRPRRYTHAEAIAAAERLNTEDPVDVWEARKLPA